MAIRPWPSLAYATGLLLIYVGERLLAAGQASAVLTVVGVAAVLGAAAWRGLAARKASAGVRSSVAVRFCSMSMVPDAASYSATYSAVSRRSCGDLASSKALSNDL